MKKNTPKILIAAGEPAGIGLDLCLKLAYKKFPAEISIVGNHITILDRAKLYKDNKFSNVDFPDPEGPTTESNSPSSTLNETPATAFTGTVPIKYVLVTSSNEISGATILTYSAVALHHPCLEDRPFEIGGMFRKGHQPQPTPS